MASVIGRVSPWRQTAWDWRAAGNFIFGGSGAGLLFIAAIVAGPGYPVQALLGMTLVAAGLLCVWAEIGRPWRALNVFRHAQTSWMTREALVAPLLFAAGASAALLGGGFPAWIAAALGLTYCYCQARMLHAGRGIPAWRHGYVVPLMLITGCTEGAGWCVATQVLLDARRALAWLPWILAALLVARVLTFAGYRAALARSGAPRSALTVLRDVHWPLAVLDIGAALAAIGAVIAAVSWIAAIAGVVAVLAGALLKFTIVVRAAFNQGFTLARLPDRGSGSTGPAVKPGW